MARLILFRRGWNKPFSFAYLCRDAVRHSVFPDYEGWLKWSDALYAPDAVICAIGSEPQKFHDCQKSMKDQRDAFSMDMGEIENCVAENDTAAISYRMYMTPKADCMNLKKGICYVIKVTEFNRFGYVEGHDEPMVISLDLIATGFDV